MNDNYSIPDDLISPSFCKSQSVLSTQSYFPWEKYITSLDINSRLKFMHFRPYNTIISGKQNFTGIQTINLTAKIS